MKYFWKNIRNMEKQNWKQSQSFWRRTCCTMFYTSTDTSGDYASLASWTWSKILLALNNKLRKATSSLISLNFSSRVGWKLKESCDIFACLSFKLYCTSSFGVHAVFFPIFACFLDVTDTCLFAHNLQLHFLYVEYILFITKLINPDKCLISIVHVTVFTSILFCWRIFGI